MKTKTLTVISHETHEELSVRLFLRPQTNPDFGWCEQCGASAQLIAPEVAGQLADLSVREIYRLIETGAIHFKEGAEGRVYVCFDSIGARHSEK